jgi:hypothetical protein
MNRPCPQCGSTETGPSFTFDWDKDDTGQVIARNPFFACVDCEHSWQVNMVLVVGHPTGLDNSESINRFVEAVEKGPTS